MRERNSYTKIFRSQLQILKDCGYPKLIIQMLAEKEEKLIVRPEKKIFKKGYFPFLPVIPWTFSTIHDQMQRICIDGEKRGYADIDPLSILLRSFDPFKSTAPIPIYPYYILDVENGTETLGKDPRETGRLIKAQGRRGLIDVEIISLAVQNNVLSFHNMIALVPDRDGYALPILYIDPDQGSRPVLTWLSPNKTYENAGIPSCDIEFI